MLRLIVWLFGLMVSAVAMAGAEPLPVEQAFRFSARALDEKTLELRYDITDGYYLYRDKFKFVVEPAPAKLSAPQLPAGKMKKDENFGNVEIYRGKLVFKLPIEAAGLAAVTLKATSQGCADLGVCYPPNPQSVQVAMTNFSSIAGDANANADPVSGGDESSRIARLLKHASFWAIIAGFFGSGVLLAFTPCVFPMIPILSGIIVGHGHTLTKSRAFTLSLGYVLGMAVTYAAAGVAAGLSGSLLSVALQNVWVLGGFAAIFVLLSLSMFGFYELQLPSFLQSKISEEANRQKGGSLHGVALMGALSAVIVGPCVAAPLAGALLYIAQTRDALLGGSALFAMALGMGAPLMVVGMSTRHLLPHSGPWMEAVKKFFGVMLLALAIWLVSPVIPPAAQLLAWGALAIGSAVYLRAIDPLPANTHGAARFWKGIGVILLLAGAALVIGALGGSRDPLQPLGFLHSGAVETGTKFQRVKNVAELDERLKTTKQAVMLDFYADWCVSCKEMERDTFSDPRVKAKLNTLLLLQADVTANSEDDQALLKRFNLFGPPGIIFFDAHGQEVVETRVVGYLSPDEFLKVLDRIR